MIADVSEPGTTVNHLTISAPVATTSARLDVSSTPTVNLGRKRPRVSLANHPNKRLKQRDEPEVNDEEDVGGLDVIPASPRAVQLASQRERDVEEAFAEATKDPDNTTITIRTGDRTETITLANMFQKVFDLQHDQRVEYREGKYTVVQSEDPQATTASRGGASRSRTAKAAA